MNERKMAYVSKANKDEEEKTPRFQQRTESLFQNAVHQNIEPALEVGFFKDDSDVVVPDRFENSLLDCSLEGNKSEESELWPRLSPNEGT